MLSKRMICSFQHGHDSRGPRGPHRVMDDDEEIPLNVVKPFDMGVPHTKALDISESSHLTTGYLLRDKLRNLES